MGEHRNDHVSGRYARLKTDWILRGWSDAPFVLINWTRAGRLELPNKAFYVAQSCDGATDFDSIAFLPDHLALLDRLIAEGIAEQCEKGAAIDRSQRYRLAKNHRLSGLQWSVTGLCNLNCRHCYMESPSRRYGELSSEKMMRIIEQFEMANVCEVSLTGGEPFLRRDLSEIITTLAEKRIWISEIYSNGLLITEQILDQIKTCGLSPSFQISFDGLGSHEYMRGRKGIEARVIAAIRKIRSAGFPVVVATSIDKVTKEFLGATYNLVRELDVQSWRIAPPRETGRWKGANTQLSLGEEVQVYAPLVKRWRVDDKPFAIQLGGYFRHDGRNEQLSKDANEVRITPESFDCVACRERPYLLPDGTLLPCAGYTGSVLQDRMPNIMKDEIGKAWDESFLRFIANIRKKDLLDKNAECSQCKSFEECGLGCRAMAVLKTGDLMSKDPLACELVTNGYANKLEELASTATI